MLGPLLKMDYGAEPLLREQCRERNSEVEGKHEDQKRMKRERGESGGDHR